MNASFSVSDIFRDTSRYCSMLISLMKSMITMTHWQAKIDLWYWQVYWNVQYVFFSLILSSMFSVCAFLNILVRRPHLHLTLQLAVCPGNIPGSHLMTSGIERVMCSTVLQPHSWMASLMSVCILQYSLWEWSFSSLSASSVNTYVYRVYLPLLLHVIKHYVATVRSPKTHIHAVLDVKGAIDARVSLSLLLYLCALYLQLVTIYSFLDYVMGGCQINFTVCEQQWTHLLYMKYFIDLL